MQELLHAYPYLLGSLALLVLASLALWARPEHRRGMVWSGLVSTPCALLAVVFVPHYWEPQQVFWFVAGPEDLIFSFANGVVVWGMVADGDLEITRVPPWSRTTWRLVLLLAVFSLQWLALDRLGLRLMDGACLSATTILAFLMLRQPDLWRAAVRGSVLFLTYYVLWLIALDRLAPGFLAQWKHERLSGLRLGPIPAEELLWALLFGAVWPCLMAFLTRDQEQLEGEIP